MDDQISKNIARGQEVARIFGYEKVLARECYATFHSVSELSSKGFENVNPGLYCRSVTDSIIQVVRLSAWKGSAYSPICGVSLSFMPHAWDPSLRWHNGTKAARLDLFEQNVGLPTNQGEWRGVADTGYMNAGNGKRYLELTCRSMWERASPDIDAWFARTSGLDDVLTVAREQCPTARRAYSTHNPDPELVLPFILARLGRGEEARDLFARYPIERLTEIGRNMLEKALAQVCDGQRV